MFGLSTFSGASFAALGPAFYSLTITEDSLLNDSSTQTFYYIVNFSEPITIEDVNQIVATFFGAVIENSAYADVNVIGSSVSAYITENIASLDTSIINAQFSQNVAENFISESIETLGIVFSGVVVENFSADSFNSVIRTSIQTITENITSADASVQQSNFLNNIVENTDLIQSPQITGGWIKIITADS